MSSDRNRVDYAIVGGGVIGLAAAWQLAERGASVRLFERFEPHHTRGASHGSTRNMNNAYDEEVYLDLYDEALGLWRGLETRTGTELLRLHGLVTHGEAESVDRARALLAARGARIDMLSPAAAGERWGGMRLAGPVLLSHETGIAYAARALDVFAAAARERGAVIEHGARVSRIEPAGEAVRIERDGAPDVVAGHAIIAAGAWSSGLLDGILDLPPLTVTEEHPAHFAPRDPGLVWPSFNHLLPSGQLDAFGGNVYGMPSPGEGVKVGFHRVGAEVDPDHRPFRASDEQRAQLRDYVAEWFPGLDADRPQEISCTYTSTASGRFVLDRVASVTVAAGFSGHGFKFAPAIGRVLADAASGEAMPPAMFRLSAHTV